MTLLILAAAMYGFVSEKFAPDVTSLLALLSLLLTGVLTPYEAFSGFSHPATISVAAVLVLSAGVERSHTADAGIQRGDVIEQLNQQPVRSVADLRATLERSGKDPLLLLVNHRGTTIFVTIRPR